MTPISSSLTASRRQRRDRAPSIKLTPQKANLCSDDASLFFFEVQEPFDPHRQILPPQIVGFWALAEETWRPSGFVDSNNIKGEI